MSDDSQTDTHDSRHFVALPDDSFICQDCLRNHPEIDVSLDETEVWSEDSDGWLEAISCKDCGRDIPVEIGSSD